MLFKVWFFCLKLVCQHNLYKYIPFFPKQRPKKNIITLYFPQEFEKIIISLTDSKIRPSKKIMEKYSRTLEDFKKEMKKIEFDSTSELNLFLEQFYLTYVNLFNFENWYPRLLQIQNESKFKFLQDSILCKFEEDELKFILSLSEKSNQGRYLNNVMHEIIEFSSKLKSKYEEQLKQLMNRDSTFFFKLNTRSPKDSYYYKENLLFSSISSQKKLNQCEARTFVDVISALVGSERTTLDIKSYLDWKTKDRPSMYLIIQKWIRFPSKYEFRTFVFEKKLTALNPICFKTFEQEYLDKDFQTQLIDSILKLHHSIKNELPWNNYIMDIIYDINTKESIICEFNPFGPYSSTGSHIFSWELDKDILYGNNMKNDQPVFRFPMEYHKFYGNFELKIPKYFDITEKFLTDISKAQRCPCCKRILDKSECPKTNMIHFIE